MSTINITLTSDYLGRDTIANVPTALLLFYIPAGIAAVGLRLMETLLP